MQLHKSPVAQRQGQAGEHAGFATEFDRPSRQRVPTLVVPKLARHDPCQPEPPHELVFVRIAFERVKRSSQWLDAGVVTVRVSRDEPVEEQIDRSHWLCPEIH